MQSDGAYQDGMSAIFSLLNNQHAFMEAAQKVLNEINRVKGPQSREFHAAADELNSLVMRVRKEMK